MKVILVVLIVLVVHSCSFSDGRADVAKDCVNFEKFEVRDRIFECREVKVER